MKLIGSGQWGNCPIWIAGRPYALDRCWTELFNDDRWQFLRVEPLAEPEIRFYMTRHAGVPCDAGFAGRPFRYLNQPAEVVRETLVHFYFLLEDPPGVNHTSEQARLQRALDCVPSHVVGVSPAVAVDERCCIKNPFFSHFRSSA